ncbi:FAD-dependent monooxygenase [Actinosynnema pretiosum]|uniref:Monooxygenase n=1 Tax=Actinosynnema pretiosum TaxID=42197 RepID=A0A290ZAN9_9PSEU|nr:FAD-dependent monooxygenase [Actinosynnema pretiosum]ATE56043.1 monooxygenase [Actinosynnema pretiosum]
MRAVVVGGGVSGPVVGMALRKAGWDAVVLEARDTPPEGLGDGLSVAPNGMRALDVLGLGDAVRGVGDDITGLVVRNGAGRVLGELTSDPAMLLVWRGELRKVLRAEAARRGVRVLHGRRLLHVNEREAVFADGSRERFDLLVGADGVRSAVRRYVVPEARPRYAGVLGFGGNIPFTGQNSTGGKVVLVHGRRGFFGYQVLEDSSGGWFAHLPSPRALTIAQVRERDPKDWMAELTSVFGEDRGPAVELIGRTAPDALVLSGALEELDPLPRWSRGNVVLVGDAAHAQFPNSGQGVALAVEDAVELARCVRDLGAAGGVVAFERLRRARVERIGQQAGRAVRNAVTGPVGRAVRDLVMPVAIRRVGPSAFPWHRHEIDWDARVTG